MAFGYRLRSQQSSRVQVNETRAQQQEPPPPTSSNSSSSGRHATSNQDTHTHTSRQPLHRIRLDGDSSSSSSAQAPPQQSHNNYLQQRLERAASNISSATSSSNSNSSSSGTVHGGRRGRELASSVLETAHTQSPQVRPGRTMTTVGVPMTATSFLDDHAQAMELPRRRRGTTSVYSSARSTTSSSSAAASESEHRAPEPKVDVLFKGHLMVKRGLLKGLDKRFYFLTRGAPELYCCKDETSFDLWYASGWGVDASSAVAKSSGLAPVLVCTVLRADRAGDAGGNDRTIVLVAAPANGASAAKPATLKLYAESAEKCERWLHALHRVQLTRRAVEPQDADRSSPLAASSSSSHKSSSHSRHREREPEDDVVASPRLHAHVRMRQASRSDASQQSLPRAYANGLLRAASSRSDDAGSIKSSSSSASDAAASVRSHAGLSNTGSQGNVLLFVPAAGSAISVSDSKLALARKQIDELVTAGAKRPTRSGMESDANGAPIAWRFGAPEYALADLEYMKHKEREHDATPLESYVEACCQTFVMEATHKARYDDWVSVERDLFYLQVNDGPRVAGACIDDHDLFGLLFVNDVDVTDVDAKEGDAKHPRAILAEAFTEGFPMEVLAVYTQPPQCAFAWRHWGPFTGSYKGVKGDGRRLEIRGFGQIQIDASKMLHLRLFFKAKDLFDQLNVAAAELGAKARDVQRARAASSAVLPVPAVTTGATTTAAVPATTATTTPARSPATAPAKSKATLTADIMKDLANFTIASSTAARSKGTAAAAVG